MYQKRFETASFITCIIYVLRLAIFQISHFTVQIRSLLMQNELSLP